MWEKVIMRKVLIPTILTVAGMLILLIGTDYRADANTPQLLTGILNKMEKAHQEMKSLKADLIQETTNSQIGITDTLFGAILYKPAEGKAKGKLRIDYSKPNKDIVALVGENFTLYQPRINQALKTTIAKASKGSKVGPLYGLDSSLKSVVGTYNIDYLRDEAINGQPATVIRLTPKTNGQFNSIDIWVLQNGLPSQWKVIDRNGDHAIYTLKNLQLNSNIPDSAFNINLPNGTKVIDKI
jgi:outer membrane lipoprotein-sorting protein